MRSNSCFHDYRIERIEYVAGKDYVDLFLKIDQTEGALLRFVDIANAKVNGNIDYKADCLWAATDGDGVPVEMPTYHIDCDCVYYDKKYHEHI